MRIGVLTTSYPRTADDWAGHFVASLAREIARFGDVDVVCASERWPIFYRGGAPAALQSPANWWHAARFSAQFLRRAQKEASKWDVILSHWTVPCGIIGALVARGRPHVAIAHGSDVRLLGRMPGGHRLLDRLGERSDMVFVADALRPAKMKGRVVPMGIDVAAYRADGARTPQDYFLYLGRLSHEKGVDLLIAALPEDATLKIAGSGPERERLQKMVGDKRVTFVGEVRGANKLALLAGARALVVPSRQDGSPTVLLEAQAAGVPIIATRVGGISQLAPHATVVEPTVSSLFQALAQMGQRATEAVDKDGVEEYDWSRLAARICPFLSGLSAKAKSGDLRVLRV
jgi:glycosyltransferase involved in cell wall biosynthesis